MSIAEQLKPDARWRIMLLAVVRFPLDSRPSLIKVAKKDRLRARHRPCKFLLRLGKRPDKTMKSGTAKYPDRIKANVKFAQPGFGSYAGGIPG